VQAGLQEVPGEMIEDIAVVADCFAAIGLDEANVKLALALLADPL
jgi:hypothetical protein